MEGDAAESQTQDLWLKPPAFCHRAMTYTDNHASLSPSFLLLCSSLLLYSDINGPDIGLHT